MIKQSTHLIFLGIYTLIAAGLIALLSPGWAMTAVLVSLPILYILFETKIYTNDSKVKIAQAFAYAVSAITLIFSFNCKLFLLALIGGWVLFGIGVSICLHKWASHRTFAPKNVFWKTIILFFGTLCTLGSTISWAAGHREHHRFTDKVGDPHRPAGSLWHKIKVYFYYFQSSFLLWSWL